MIGYLPRVGVQLILEGLIPNCPQMLIKYDTNFPFSSISNYLIPREWEVIYHSKFWFTRKDFLPEQLFFGILDLEFLESLLCNFLLLVIVVVSELWFLCSFSWPQFFLSYYWYRICKNYRCFSETLEQAFFSFLTAFN